MRRLLNLTALTATTIIIAGCSSITGGTHEKIEIASSPEGAHCKLYRKSEGYIKSIVTPGAKYIRRSIEPITIVCQKNGYETVSLLVEPKKRNEEMVGNLATIGLGAVLDIANDATFELPDKVEVIMKRSE